MTYCAAVATKTGQVFISDSRTNAGVDQINTYKKMFVFGNDEERKLILLTAGNLATSQAVISQIKNDIQEKSTTSINTIMHMSDIAEYIGELSRNEQKKYSQDDKKFESSFILGGQIKDDESRLLYIYPEGNFIFVSENKPFLQLGETKYGKPILDRIINTSTSLENAAKCLLVSMDSSMKSNVTVGPPIELLIYENDSFVVNRYAKLSNSSEYIKKIRKAWDKEIKQAFDQLPALELSWSKPSQLDV
jgi:putative proteasome-type protease